MTIIFSNGFDEGDFSKWTLTTGGPIVQSSVKYSGSSAMETDTSNEKTARKTFTSSGTVYARCYVNFADLPTSGNYLSVLGLAGGDSTVAYGVKNDGGTLKWSQTWTDGARGVLISSPNPVINTWYCLEVYWEYIDATHYLTTIWVDGVQLYSDTLNVSFSSTISRIDAGGWDKTEALTNYIDNVAVSADAYIGLVDFVEDGFYFDDGFESNDFSKWTYAHVDAYDGYASITATHPFKGVYSAQFNCNQDYMNAGVRVSITETNESYMRFYIRFSGLGNLANSDTFYAQRFHTSDPGYSLFRLYYTKVSGNTRIGCNYWDSTTETWVETDHPFVDDKWYCIEMHSKVNASTGFHEVYIDDVLVWSVTGIDTTFRGNIFGIDVGTSWIQNPNAVTIYVDNVVSANAYIGPVDFEDGFESNDFSMWSSATHAGSGSDPTIETDGHHGAYNVEMTTTSNTDYGYCTKEFVATPITYFRYYIKFIDGLPTTDGRLVIGEIVNESAGWETSCMPMVKKSGAGLYWGLFKPSETLEDKASNPVVNKWYCIEIMRDNTNNLCKLWVDGILRVTDTTALVTDNDLVYLFVSTAVAGSYNATVAFDCVKISDSYIGPHKWFSSGFESNSFDDWLAVVNDPVIVSTTSHTGYDSMLADAEYEYLRAPDNLSSEMYCRFYFKTDTLPTTQSIIIAAARSIVEGNVLLEVTMETDGSMHLWDTQNWNAISTTASFLEINRWYCIEVRYSIYTGLILWIDENYIGNLAFSNGEDFPFKQLNIGHWYSGGYTGNIWFDDVAISDTYIGPELIFEDGFERKETLYGIFETAFELGDFTGWTNQQSSNATISVTSNVPHEGVYSAEVYSNLNGGEHYAITQKVLIGINRVNARFYFRLNAAIPSGKCTPALISTTDLSDNRESVFFENVGGVIYTRILHTASGAASNEYAYGSTVTLNANTWYCLELEVGVSNTIGWESVWLDGEVIYNATGRDNDGFSALRYGVGFGLNVYPTDKDVNWGSALTAYFDDIKIAISRIGLLENNLVDWGIQGTDSSISTASYSGTYAILTENSTESYINVDLPVSYSDLFVRFYMKFTSLPTSGKIIWINNIFDASWSYSFRLGLYNNSGMKWAFFDGEEVDASDIVIDRWYCIEIERKVGASSTGYRKLWVDGVNKVNTENVTVVGESKYVYLGNIASDDATQVYIDDVIISENPISRNISDLKSDNFNDNSLDTQWTAFNATGDTVNETGSKIAMYQTSGTGVGLISTSSYNLTDSEIEIDYDITSANKVDGVLMINLTKIVSEYNPYNESNWIRIYLQDDGALYLQYRVNGAAVAGWGTFEGQPTTGTIKLKINGGMLYCFLNDTLLNSIVYPLSSYVAYVYTYTAGGGNNTVYVDNFVNRDYVYTAPTVQECVLIIKNIVIFNN